MDSNALSECAVALLMAASCRRRERYYLETVKTLSGVSVDPQSYDESQAALELGPQGDVTFVPAVENILAANGLAAYMLHWEDASRPDEWFIATNLQEALSQVTVRLQESYPDATISPRRRPIGVGRNGKQIQKLTLYANKVAVAALIAREEPT